MNRHEEETNSCVTENDGDQDHANDLENEIPTTCSIIVSPPNEPNEDQSSPNDESHNSLFFNDGVRSVDYVLAWKNQFYYENDDAQISTKEREDLKHKEKSRSDKRNNFEENLIREGLELERSVVNDEIHFVKIHAPLEVLRRYAEILKLRLPMKEVSTQIFINIWCENFCFLKLD